MIIDFQHGDQLVLIPENNIDNLVLNRLFKKMSKNKNWFVWYGDVTYRHKELMGIKIIIDKNKIK